MKTIMKILKILTKYFKLLTKKLTEWLPDIFIFIGISSLAIGLHMIYKPSAYIAAGLILMYIGWPKGNSPKKKVN